MCKLLYRATTVTNTKCGFTWSVSKHCFKLAVGGFISHLHSGVIGLGWHLMWQTMCENTQTQ